MINCPVINDQLIFKPDDVDLSYSPMRGSLELRTYVLGAFNPGLCRLPNGNLLMMVRVAEALVDPFKGGHVLSLKWNPEKKYMVDEWPLEEVDVRDPRKIKILNYDFPVYALTSLSWLLPVELNKDGSEVQHIYYDKIISPQLSSQEFGIEDPRISKIDNRYYMTTCCASGERHSTMLYVSDNGLDYKNLGVILDHQNKDMLLFEGSINSIYFALTRPLGECYFATSKESDWHPGAAIHLASSPDLLHWKPADGAFLRARRSASSNVKTGGGTPPILTPSGWLMFYHGVEKHGEVGIYRTFWALLDAHDPTKVLKVEDEIPILQANARLTEIIHHQLYVENVVFTTGIAHYGDDLILASGESDLACRITRVPQNYFALHSA